MISTLGKVKMSKIANRPSQLQRDAKLRAIIERISPNTIRDDDEIWSDEKEGDKRTTPPEIIDDDDILSHDQKSDDRNRPDVMPDN